MSKILLIAALLTVGVGVRLKPMVADDSAGARVAASPAGQSRPPSRVRDAKSIPNQINDNLKQELSRKGS